MAIHPDGLGRVNLSGGHPLVQSNVVNPREFRNLLRGVRFHLGYPILAYLLLSR